MIVDAVVPNTGKAGDSSLNPEVRRAVELELEAICSDTQFSASQRNCAFLRYVVGQTLAGRATEIKERTLGKELFGRPITYDTGSDAVVRVRANEVRKRLGCYYDEHESQAGWRIQLPLRTYVPIFSQENIRSSEEAPSAKAVIEAIPAEPNILTLSQMMIPTLIALFLCAATFRWQIFSGTPYLDFWETLLAGHNGVALILDADPADSRAVTTDDLRIVSPILQTSAAFHASTQVRSNAASEKEWDQFVPIHITHRGPRLGDDQTAYVTVIPGPHAELWVGSSNLSSLELAINSLCDTDTFPSALEVALRRKTPSQLRFARNEQVTTQTISGGARHGSIRNCTATPAARG